MKKKLRQHSLHVNKYDSFTRVYYAKEHWYTTVPQKESTTPNTGTRFPFLSELHQHKPNCLECFPCLILLTYLYRSIVKQYHNWSHSTDLL